MQTVNAIYDSGNYTDVFERDIVEVEKKIIVSSPELAQDKTKLFIYLVKLRQEAGITVTVITTEPQDNLMRIQSAQIAAELLEIALEE